MPTNRRNSSTFVACVVFLLSLWPALPATAQGVLKVDTLFRSYAPDVVRYEVIGVHDDTVLIRGRNIASLPNGVPTFMVHVSKDGGQTFDSLQSLDGSRNHAPLRGLRRVVRLIGQTTPVTYVAHHGVDFTEQRVADYLDVEYAEGYFLHPTHPDTSFLLVRSSGDRYGNYREWMFYRFNDNDQWTNLYVPFPKIGLHRAITLEFDYGRPNRLYATVDSETSYGGLADHLGPKWLYYVTDDWGQTWTELEQHPLGADACNGNTSCDVRIGLPTRDQYIVRMPIGTRNITVPVIRNYVTGEVDSTMGKSLLSLVDTFLPHGYDSVKNVRFSLLTIPNIDCIDVGILMLHYDSLVGGKYILRSNWVVTTNSGASWIHALSDVSHSVRHMRLPINTASAYSCSSQAIYSTYGLGRIASDGRSETYETGVLRISLNATATSAPLYTETFATEAVAFPNPTSDFVTVNAGTVLVSDALTMTIVNSLGQTCNDSIVITPQSDDLFTIDVRRLAAGMYRVILNVGGTLQSIPLIIQR